MFRLMSLPTWASGFTYLLNRSRDSKRHFLSGKMHGGTGDRRARSEGLGLADGEMEVEAVGVGFGVSVRGLGVLLGMTGTCCLRNR